MGQELSAQPFCGCSCSRSSDFKTLTEEVSTLGPAPSSPSSRQSSKDACASAGSDCKAVESRLNTERPPLRISNASTHVPSISSEGCQDPARLEPVNEDESATTSDAESYESTHGDIPSDANSSDGEQVLVRPRTARRRAICAGALEKHVFQPPVYEKDAATIERLLRALGSCSLFMNMLSRRELEDLVNAFSIVSIDAGTRIVQQGAEGDALFAVLEGTVDCYLEQTEEQVESRARGRLSVRSSGSNNSNLSSQTGSPEDARRQVEARPRRPSQDSSSSFSSQVKKKSFIVSRTKGMLIGEVSVVCSLPRSLSVYARHDCTMGRLEREDYQKLVVMSQYHKRTKREECLRNVKLLELLGDEEIAKLADALRVKTYNSGEYIIKQGEQGKDFFIVQSGQAVAIVATFDDIQEVKRYSDGDLFGELALLKNAKRAASIKATSDVEAMYINRRSFERMLGPLSKLMKSQYIHDPRKLIADFYRPGDERGPLGSIRQAGLDQGLTQEEIGDPDPESPSTWFAVFRPTSRDAIAKMLGGFAVGKGLNVKGKSAKKNRLSGFVPFLQITDNAHKEHIREMSCDARATVYYKTEAARAHAFNSLYKIQRKEQEEADLNDLNEISEVEEEQAFGSRASTASLLSVEEIQAVLKKQRGPSTARIDLENRFVPKAYGLSLSGNLLRKAYIMQKDLTALVGWETGRSSEPAFMEMNLSAVCDCNTEPKVVLMQHDEGNAMNPHGLLVAYAEATVKPVVSDFDAFLMASRGMEYRQSSTELADLMNWELEKAEGILEEPGGDTWTTRWLSVLKKEAERGFHPRIPKYGFGDPTSYHLTADVIRQTANCGAVRHGAECFNCYFPQELDESYLVIWEGFPDKPWDYKTEPELRSFLIVRANEGYSFPLNPIWPVRDPGWYEVWAAMRENCSEDTFNAWYPPESNIPPQIENLHQRFPGGFVRLHGGDDDALSKCSDPDVQLSKKSSPQSSGRRGSMANDELATWAMSRLPKSPSLPRRTSFRRSQGSQMSTASGYRTSLAVSIFKRAPLMFRRRRKSTDSG